MAAWQTIWLVCILQVVNVASKPITGARVTLETRGEVDPSDLSNIKNWTAIGDSYAAGIGAGSALTGSGDSGCSRYDNAYPVMINEYLNFDVDGDDREFQFIACSGDTTENVLNQVADLSDSSQDLVTVSAGGNDVGFSDVLKTCIYGFSSDSTCAAAFDTAKTSIMRSLPGNVDNLLAKLDPKMRPGGIVVYTLYARFFNAATDICDDKTWNFFDPTGLFGSKLTKDKRQRMNDLVDLANVKIRDAVNNFNTKSAKNTAKYVIADYDNFIGLINGRFCEDGTTSNFTDFANQNEMFQRFNQDPPGPNPHYGDLKLKRQASVSLAVADETEKMVAVDHTFGSPENMTRLPVEFQTSEKSSVPDFIARVFHPNGKGQSIIAKAAIAAYIGQRAQDLNYDDSIPSSCNLEFGRPGKLSCNGYGPKAYMQYSDTQSLMQVACAKDIVRDGANNGTTTFTVADGQVDIYLDPRTANLTTDDCRAYLGEVIDNCDETFSDPANTNYHNYKYGGIYNWPNGDGFTRLTPLDDTHRSVYCQTMDQSGGKYTRADDLYNNINAYCDGIDPNAGGNPTGFLSGTADDFNFQIMSTGPHQFDPAVCKSSMKDLLDSCNVDPNNAISYRYSDILDLQNYKYIFQSNHVRPMPSYTEPVGECWSWYKFIYAETSVYGGGWSDSDWGSGRQGGLLDQMRGCGAVTLWKFDYYQAPDSNRYEWKSTFNLPIGTRRCVGRAMGSAGGPQKGCDGNG